MLYITLNIITHRTFPYSGAPPCSDCSLPTTRQSKVCQPWYLTCCRVLQASQGIFLWFSYFENKINLPKHNLLSHFGCCGSSCCCSRTEQFLCQSDLVQHISCLQQQSVHALTPQWFSQTWILAKKKCNGLRGYTQSATTVPRTWNNLLCSAKFDHFHLPENNAAVQPKRLHLLSLCTKSGLNHSPKWHKSYKKAGCEKKLYEAVKFMAITSEIVYAVNWSWCCFLLPTDWKLSTQLGCITAACDSQKLSFFLPSSPPVCVSQLLCLIHRERSQNHLHGFE